MENIENAAASAPLQAPPLALPDAESARRLVGKWLLTEIGTALYPARVSFLQESYTWHVEVWYSTPAQPLKAFVADVYVNAATGVFLGRPTADELLERIE